MKSIIIIIIIIVMSIYETQIPYTGKYNLLCCGEKVYIVLICDGHKSNLFKGF